MDAGAAMTAVDRGVTDAVGVMYTGKRRMLMSVTGYRLEGEVAIVRELNIEGEALDYEKILAVRLSEEVKRGSALIKIHIVYGHRIISIPLHRFLGLHPPWGRSGPPREPHTLGRPRGEP